MDLFMSWLVQSYLLAKQEVTTSVPEPAVAGSPPPIPEPSEKKLAKRYQFLFDLITDKPQTSKKLAELARKKGREWDEGTVRNYAAILMGEGLIKNSYGDGYSRA